MCKDASFIANMFIQLLGKCSPSCVKFLMAYGNLPVSYQRRIINLPPVLPQTPGGVAHVSTTQATAYDNNTNCAIA